MSIRDSFRSVFDSDYCGADEFIAKVIKPIFGEKDVDVLDVPVINPTQADEETLEKANIQELLWVATVDRVGTDPIQVFDVTLGDSTNISRARVGIQRIIRSALFPYSHAFIIFHYRVLSGTEWRFSYVYKQDKNASITDAKRFTYLFSRELHARTAIDRFEELANSNKSNDALLEAFNVEALSDDFFEEYRTQYAKFVKYITGKEYVKEAGKYVEKSTGKPNEKLYAAFNRNDKAVRDYVKKLMGRITFLHFLQRKGWMNHDMNFMLHLFQNSKHKKNYLDAVLEPLFFGILNTKPKDRHTLFKDSGWDLGLLDEWSGIPYLNGGLFEQEPFDCGKSVFPEGFFASLFQFFSEYNFTVDENDPDDAEVGVDPEMLGKIFENLLEDNKDKGAFYTPKEIVRYMCQESLISYLLEKTKISEDTVRPFVTQPYDCAEGLSGKESDLLFDALVSVKICDPAIGSGAFPMGLLNELVRCEEALVLGKEQNKDRAHLKREIIKNNIYGVDIEKGAIDIARLRFWLSLVVDEEEPSALPNLDYKIMQGNSLLESYKGVDLSHILDVREGEINFGADTRVELKEQLDLYYSCEDHNAKKLLQNKINNLVHQQVSESGGIDKSFERIDVSGNPHFFLWHTWFSDVFSRSGDFNSRSGFDIVIGNPPYVSVRTTNFDVSLKPTYKQNFELAVGQYDLYVLFIEQSYRLLDKRGTLSFIVPTRLLSNENFKPARLFLKDKLFINRYVNAEAPFETASVEANIMVCSKIQKNDKVASYKYDPKSKSFDLLVLADRGIIDSMPFSIFPFVYNDCIISLFTNLQKAQTIPLGNFLDITRGLECGYKDTCITTRKTHFPVMKAEQIKRFFVEGSASLYCIPDFNNPSKFKTKEVFEKKPKLVTKFCSGEIQFALDEVGFYNTNSVYNCSVQDIETAYYLMGVLNCPVSTFWFNVAYMNIDGLFPHIQKNQLESIPVPMVKNSERAELIRLVKNYIRTKDDKILKSIYKMVYGFYNLQEPEIKIIESL